jgi:hypothetical protein
LKIQLFFFYYKWCDAGLFFFINEFLDENNEFFSFNRFQEIYRIETPFWQHMGILHMIPQIWKVRVKLTKTNHSDNLWKFWTCRKNKKSCQYFYRKFCKATLNNQQNNKTNGNEELNTDIMNWDLICKITIYLTKTNQFTGFFSIQNIA